MRKKIYDSSSIIKLDDISHIRKTPGLYIGDTTTPINLLKEIIDNSVDEIIGGYANHIEINIHDDFYEIIDNGRGFPFEENKPPEEDCLIKAISQLKTSGKFIKNDESAYKVSTGLHGYGLKACLALSTRMEIHSCIKNKYATYIFEDGKFYSREFNKLKKKDKKFSTKVIIYPDIKYFNSSDIDLEIIKERLLLVGINYPTTYISLSRYNENGIHEYIFNSNQISNYLSEFLESSLGFKLKDDNTFVIKNNNTNGELFEIYFSWTLEDSTSPDYICSLNTIEVNDGVHIKKILSVVKNKLFKLSKKYNIHIEEYDCLNWFRAFIRLDLCNTSFESQVKLKLSSSSDISIIDNFESEFVKIIKSNEDYFIKLLKQIYKYRKSLEFKKYTSVKRNRGVNSFTKLRDCTNNNGELIIGEGNSAISGLIKVRDSNVHAVLPLRGKIPNIVKQPNLVKNEEIKDIIQAIGCKVNSENIDNLRYDKIIICTDADPDGYHISVLLMMLFSKLFPGIIKQGKLYICETPLFGCGRGKNFKPLWTKKEIDDHRDKKDFKRYKGLGSFNPEELKKFILDPKIRKLTNVKWYKDMNKLYDLLNKSSEKRLLVEDKWSI